MKKFTREDVINQIEKAKKIERENIWMRKVFFSEERVILDKNLDDIDLINVDTSHIVFKNCSLNNTYFSFHHVPVSNIFRITHDIPYTTFENCEGYNINFSRTNLIGSKFINCDFKRANFYEANLCSSILLDSDFSESTFSSAILDFSYLKSASFKGALFFEASLKNMEHFENIDLTKAINQSSLFSVRNRRNNWHNCALWN